MNVIMQSTDKKNSDGQNLQINCANNSINNADNILQYLNEFQQQLDEIRQLFNPEDQSLTNEYDHSSLDREILIDIRDSLSVMKQFLNQILQ